MGIKKEGDRFMETKKRVKCPKCDSVAKIGKGSITVFGVNKLKDIKMYRCKCGEEFLIGKQMDVALESVKKQLKTITTH